MGSGVGLKFKGAHVRDVGRRGGTDGHGVDGLRVAASDVPW